MDQMSFFEQPNGETLEEKINVMQNKIKNIRMGLFKRYSECEKAIEFLEGEIEDMIKEHVINQKVI